MQKTFFRSRTLALAFLPLAMSLLAPVAMAQTGAALLVKPWPETNQVFEGAANSYFNTAGHIKESNNPFQLFEYESVGRFRIIPGNEISPRIGYDMKFFDNHTHNRQIPDQLSDESVALGTGIAKSEDWLFGITLGVGYAGSSAFDNGAGWYGKADLVIAREMSDTDALGIIIDYDGHRTYLPDFPLTGFGYSHRFDPALQMVLGIPYSSIDWKPIKNVEVHGEYDLLTDMRINVGYEFVKHWIVYTRYDYERDAFSVSGLGKDHRLLFFDRRAEVGVRFAPDQHLALKLGIGYSWGGDFTSGFDFRSDNRLADFSDTPYLRGGLELRY